MANQKISDLTSQPTLSAIQGLAGYDATGNVRISGPNIISAIPTLYTTDGTLTASRTITQSGFSVVWDNGQHYFKTASTTQGLLNFRIGGSQKGQIGVTSSGGSMYFRNSGGSDYYNLSQNGLYLNSNAGIGLLSGASARLHVKGSGSTFATTSILVENFNGDDLIKVLDSGRFFIGKGANNLNDSNIVYGNSTLAQGTSQVCLGNAAQVQSGTYNIAVGAGATTATVSYSVSVGGITYTGGSNAVAIGYSSRSFTGGVSIGYNAGTEDQTGANTISIGNSAKHASGISNSIILNASGSTTATAATTSNTLSVHMTSSSTPDFKVIGNEGMIPPSITTTTRDAIVSPDTGSTIYNTTDNKLQYYDGTSWQSLSNEPYLNVFDTSPASPDPLSIYNDGIIQVWLDESTSDDIEVQVLTDPAGSALVNFTWWSPTGATDGFVNINAASGITATNINFNDYDVHQMSVFAPSDQSYPYYEIRVTKSGTAFSGVPAIIRVSKYTI